MKQEESRHMIKIWLDDIRGKPDDSWVHIRNKEELQELFRNRPFVYIEVMDFDHDLGMDEHGNPEPSGYDIIQWMSQLCMALRNSHFWPWEIRVHSDNPPGLENISTYASNFSSHAVATFGR